LEFLAEVRRDLGAVETSGERRAALQQQLNALAGEYEVAAKKISAERREAARRLGKNIEQELASLAMEKTRVEIKVSPAEWSESGADAVEFLIAPNVGEDLKPLDKIASGGELS